MDVDTCTNCKIMNVVDKGTGTPNGRCYCNKFLLTVVHFWLVSQDNILLHLL